MGSTIAKNIFIGIFIDATFTMTRRRRTPKNSTAVEAIEITVENLVELTALVASSFVANNSVSLSELSNVIGTIHGALLALVPAREGRPGRAPAVPPEQSVTRDYIVCLDDGRRLKTLKRHIRQKFSLTPEEYRKRWQLPSDYPMVAPGYSERRSALAKRNSRRSDALDPDQTP